MSCPLTFGVTKQCEEIQDMLRCLTIEMQTTLLTGFKVPNMTLDGLIHTFPGNHSFVENIIDVALRGISFSTFSQRGTAP